MNKIFVILRKEWLELRQQRGLLASTTLLPLLFSIMPVGIMLGTNASDASTGNINQLPPSAFTNPALAGLSPKELLQAVLGQQVSLLLLILPILLPSIIASYSIVGEKTSRTLEPLLATPIRTWELLVGKALASLIPSIGLTWLAGAIFVAGVALSAGSRVLAAVVSPGWLLVLLLCTPFVALIAVAGMVAVSSRVNDPRTAQQFSAIGIVPFMALFFAQITGLVVLGPLAALVGAVVLALLALLAVWGATRLFQREVILTRWK